jgi:hypothetical protein
MTIREILTPQMGGGGSLNPHFQGETDAFFLNGGKENPKSNFKSTKTLTFSEF